eukprot:m.28787 g.28787  ORF g.28787 m.28787 type:complete len:1086 (-) comp9078_c0_seq2:2927-6184(-)
MEVSHLNDQQLKAANHGEGPLLVLAGPGSGKTRVICSRVFHLTQEMKVAPRSIVLVTFTNKAATEMKARIGAMLPDVVGRLYIGTFHSIANQLLRKHGTKVGIANNFTIMDSQEGEKRLKALLKSGEHDITADKSTVKGLKSLISKAKMQGLLPDDVQRLVRSKPDHMFRAIVDVYSEYQQQLQSEQALDFDDLLLLCEKLLVDFPKTADFCSYVLVDEFQDTSTVQYHIVKLLAHRTQNVMAVGDPDQSIYSWRQAQSQCYDSFKKDFQNVTVVTLDQNYRSTTAILAAASAVLGTDKEGAKALWTQNGQGPNVLLEQAQDATHEALRITDAIAQLSKQCQGCLAYSHIAVLVRTNAMTRAIEQAFAQASVPYHIVGGTRFFDRAEIKDILAYVRLLTNPNDNQAFQRAMSTPKRGFGDKFFKKLSLATEHAGGSMYKTLSRSPGSLKLNTKQTRAVKQFLQLFAKLRKCETLRTLVSMVVTSIDYDAYLKATYKEQAADKLENIQELLVVTEQYEREAEQPTSVAAASKPAVRPLMDQVQLFLEQAALQVPKQDDVVHESVTIATVHAAKGLEWPVVFVPGVEEGILPHSRSLQELAQRGNSGPLEEEQRLLYVAMTRAKYFLGMLYCLNRNGHGKGILSRFVSPLTQDSKLFSSSLDVKGAKKCTSTLRTMVSSQPGVPISASDSSALCQQIAKMLKRMDAQSAESFAKGHGGHPTQQITPTTPPLGKDFRVDSSSFPTDGFQSASSLLSSQTKTSSFTSAGKGFGKGFVRPRPASAGSSFSPSLSPAISHMKEEPHTSERPKFCTAASLLNSATPRSAAHFVNLKTEAKVFVGTHLRGRTDSKAGYVAKRELEHANAYVVGLNLDEEEDEGDFQKPSISCRRQPHVCTSAGAVAKVREPEQHQPLSFKPLAFTASTAKRISSHGHNKAPTPSAISAPSSAGAKPQLHARSSPQHSVNPSFKPAAASVSHRSKAVMYTPQPPRPPPTRVVVVRHTKPSIATRTDSTGGISSTTPARKRTSGTNNLTKTQSIAKQTGLSSRSSNTHTTAAIPPTKSARAPKSKRSKKTKAHDAAQQRITAFFK